MLEIRNVTKIYSSKGGVETRALDDVSVTFPERGMVFLLGRSGSGKSTLLNVAGGLDRPDSGEIIVKGRSSQNFSASDFDSYRNTFIGFVFQEYNILNEFTVEQNIALALQLQSKPNDKKAVDDLLEKVDLAGIGKRKPNTLSGGQKQRVAIARALIKEPEIIMADEPTGALDSNTGRQVLETLKKLSETKLVIVVSHDREFAETYGDRIIELKDGKIISDVSKAYSEPKQLNENVRVVSDDTISIADASKITDADVKNIVNLLKKNGGEAIISAGSREMPNVKRACRINDSGNKEYFKDTSHVETAEYDGSETKFIKSRLPASRAFKMGASGLKTKPIRLIFTILLAVVAFLMFGVVSTFMLYDPDYSVSEALKEADYPSLTVAKYYNVKSQSMEVHEDGSETVSYESESNRQTLFGEQELKDRNARSGGKYAGVFSLRNDSSGYYGSVYLTGYSVMLADGNNTVSAVAVDDMHPVTQVVGFTDCGEKYLSDNHFTLVGDGHYPKDKTEIAVPQYIAELFVSENSNIKNVSDVVGKQLKLSGVDAIGNNTSFRISGVYKMENNIPAKFNNISGGNVSPEEKKQLQDLLKDYLAGSFNTVLYVSDDFYGEYKDNIYSYSGVYYSPEYFNGLAVDSSAMSDWQVDQNSGYGIFTENMFKRYPGAFTFYDFDGNKKQVTTLSGRQAYMSKSSYDSAVNDVYRNAFSSVYGWSKYDKEVYDEVKDIDFGQYYNTVPKNWIAIADEHYSRLAERDFYFNNLYIKLNNIVNWDHSEYSDFFNAFDAINGTVQHIEDGGQISDIYNATDAQWSALKAAADKYKNDEKFKVALYAAYAEEMKYDMPYDISKEINEIYGKEFYEFTNIGSDLEGKDTLISIVDQYYERVMGCGVGDTAVYSISLKLDTKLVLYYKDYLGNSGKLDLLGYYVTEGSSSNHPFVALEFVKQHSRPSEGSNYYSRESSDYVAPADAKYNYLIALTDNTQDEIAVALDSGNALVQCKIANSVYGNLTIFLDMITSMQTIFLIVGLVVGVFAALMLLNFISVSISAKRKDIGILRAVGARGSDVFKIFFSEALIIAVICFLLATVGAFFVCNILNSTIAGIVSMKLLDFGVINIVLILAISLGVSFIATFFPVFFAARKRPVESIRAL